MLRTKLRNKIFELRILEKLYRALTGVLDLLFVSEGVLDIK